MGAGAGGGGLAEFHGHGALPEVEGLAEGGRGGGVVTGGELTVALGGQALEAVGVHAVGVDGQPVSERVGLDQFVRRRAPQVAAEPGDLGLQGVEGVAGRMVAVQALDEGVDGDGPAGLQGEEDQQGAGSRAADGHRASVVTTHHELAQHPEPHGVNYGLPGSRFRPR